MVQLVLTDEQRMLQETAADFVRANAPVSRVRELRDSRDPDGFSRTLWGKMAELGWLAVPFPEDLGGLGMGLADLAVILEQLGTALAPEPLLTSVLLGGGALMEGSSQALREAWIPKIASGEAIVTLAYQGPGSRYDLSAVATIAEPSGDGWSLTGTKIQVPDGHVADALIVSAMTGAGLRLFLVEAGTEGLSVTRQFRVDGRGAALVELDGVQVGADAELGDLDVLQRVVDRATVGLCAEMLGGMSRAFADTLAYLKERKQFGVVIGSFQALKHRAARCFIEVELARSAAMLASRVADASPKALPRHAALAKARCSDAYMHIANEAVQMFGGIGMTDEHDIGFFLKRARGAALTFGDPAHQRRRWASLGGY